MSAIVPEVVAAVTAVIAEVDPDKLNDREIIAYLAGISETASGMLKLKPDLKAHADLVMDLANRVFYANKAAEQRGYDKAVTNLLDRDKFATYRQQQGHPDANLTETQRRAAVAYLEAVQEQP